MSAIYSQKLKVGDDVISKNSPTYFIADIAASHDGDINRAVELIWLAKEAGANAAKFQHFSASTIVSDFGFRNLKSGISHQSDWEKSVYDVYKDAEVGVEWTERLKSTCDSAGITFFTSPYSFELLDLVDTFVPAHKIGSGDVTWHEMIERIASKNKPYFVATGASALSEVVSAVGVATAINPDICLMQCNTNYTGSLENFKYINLNVLNQYAKLFPGMLLGLSDHTPGHSTVLGAVTLGASVVEKHFTDDKTRAGPDHGFSMDPPEWRSMVEATRELELALGDGSKIIEENEKATVIVQRRSLCAAAALKVGHVISKNDLVALRPCPEHAFQPFEIDIILGRSLKTAVSKGESIKRFNIDG